MDRVPPYIDVSALYPHRFPFLLQHTLVLRSRDRISTSETIACKPGQEVFVGSGKNRIGAGAKFGSSYPQYYRSSEGRPLYWFASAYRRSRRGSRTSTWSLNLWYFRLLLVGVQHGVSVL